MLRFYLDFSFAKVTELSRLLCLNYVIDWLISKPIEDNRLQNTNYLTTSASTLYISNPQSKFPIDFK